MNHNYKCRLENIFLRPLIHSDIELLRVWRNDPHNTEFLNKIPYITEEMQEQWYQNYLNDRDELIFAIVEEKELHRVVGSLALYNFEEDKIEVGKIMVGDKDAHGMKVGANATKAAKVIAFEHLGKKTLYLHVFERNVAGVKTYKAAGFRELERYCDNQSRVELIMQVTRENMEDIKNA